MARKKPWGKEIPLLNEQRAGGLVGSFTGAALVRKVGVKGMGKGKNLEMTLSNWVVLGLEVEGYLFERETSTSVVVVGRDRSGRVKARLVLRRDL